MVEPYEVTVGILTALPVELRAMAELVDIDEDFRDRLARDFPDMPAVEMEGPGIAAGTSMISKGWFMVRGVADYSEVAGKNDVWHAVRILPLLADEDQRELDRRLAVRPSDLDIEPAWQEVMRQDALPDPDRPPASSSSCPVR